MRLAKFDIVAAFMQAKSKYHLASPVELVTGDASTAHGKPVPDDMTMGQQGDDFSAEGGFSKSLADFAACSRENTKVKKSVWISFDPKDARDVWYLHRQSRVDHGAWQEGVGKARE